MIEEENLIAPGLRSTQGGAHTGDGAERKSQNKLLAQATYTSDMCLSMSHFLEECLSLNTNQPVYEKQTDPGRPVGHVYIQSL